MDINNSKKEPFYFEFQEGDLEHKVIMASTRTRMSAISSYEDVDNPRKQMETKMKTGMYYLLCEAGKSGGFGPYVGVDSDSGFKLIMVPDRMDAKRYFDRAEAEADVLKLEGKFGTLEVEERIGSV